MVGMSPSSPSESQATTDEDAREFGYYVFWPALVFGFLLVATVLVCVVRALVDALWTEAVSGVAFAVGLLAYLGRVYLQVRTARVVTDDRELTFTDWSGRQASMAWDRVTEMRFEGWPRDLRWRGLRIPTRKWDRTITLRDGTLNELEIARGLEFAGALRDEIVSRARLAKKHGDEWLEIYELGSAQGCERAGTETGGEGHDDI
jgi:hypothetical protein